MFFSYQSIAPNEGQYLFNQTLKGIIFFLKLLFKTVFHASYIATAYLLTTLFLNQKDSGLLWVTTLLCTTYLLVIVFRFLQSSILQLQHRHPYLALLLFLLLTVYRLAVPVWVVWQGSVTLFPSLQGNILLHGWLTLAISISASLPSSFFGFS